MTLVLKGYTCTPDKWASQQSNWWIFSSFCGVPIGELPQTKQNSSSVKWTSFVAKTLPPVPWFFQGAIVGEILIGTWWVAFFHTEDIEHGCMAYTKNLSTSNAVTRLESMSKIPGAGLHLLGGEFDKLGNLRIRYPPSFLDTFHVSYSEFWSHGGWISLNLKPA